MGNTTNVSKVAEINPPMTTVANGRCTSAPAVVEEPSGEIRVTPLWPSSVPGEGGRMFLSTLARKYHRLLL